MKYQKAFKFQQSINKVSPQGRVSTKGEREYPLPSVTSSNKIKCCDFFHGRVYILF